MEAFMDNFLSVRESSRKYYWFCIITAHNRFSYNILKSTPPLFSGFNMALEGYIYVLIENVTIDDLADPVKV